MTHDPLCPDASTTGGGCEPMCESCDDCQCELIAKVSERAISAQIDNYRHGWEMGVTEAREAVIALPWNVSMLGATVLRTDMIEALDDLLDKS